MFGLGNESQSTYSQCLLSRCSRLLFIFDIWKMLNCPNYINILQSFFMYNFWRPVNIMNQKMYPRWKKIKGYMAICFLSCSEVILKSWYIIGAHGLKGWQRCNDYLKFVISSPMSEYLYFNLRITLWLPLYFSSTPKWRTVYRETQESWLI